MAEEKDAAADSSPPVEATEIVTDDVVEAPALTEEVMSDPVTIAAATPATTPDSPPTSEKSTASQSGNRFYTLFQSIQRNIEALNDTTKLIEKTNDRILFQASAITPKEESSIIQMVAKIIREANMKARDTARLVRQLRIETVKPTPEPGSETKADDEKSEEELAEESRDVG